MIQSSVECVATSRSSKSPRNCLFSVRRLHIAKKQRSYLVVRPTVATLAKPSGQRFAVSDPGDRSHPILESPERCPLFQLLSQSGCKKLRLAPGQGEQLRAHRSLSSALGRASCARGSARNGFAFHGVASSACCTPPSHRRWSPFRSCCRGRSRSWSPQHPVRLEWQSRSQFLWLVWLFSLNRHSHFSFAVALHTISPSPKLTQLAADGTQPIAESFRGRRRAVCLAARCGCF
jgi:hypothetical protein